MKPLNSRAVSESLESYTGDLVAESPFFSALSAGEAHPGHVRDVFGQYYLWRNRFHRWFGICVAKSAPVDEALAGRGLAGPGRDRAGRSPGRAHHHARFPRPGSPAATVTRRTVGIRRTDSLRHVHARAARIHEASSFSIPRIA